MSAMQEELITELEAARYLGISPQRLREFAERALLQSIDVQTPHGSETMYYRGEVLRLKEHLRRHESAAEEEEWPDVLGE